MERMIDDSLDCLSSTVQMNIAITDEDLVPLLNSPLSDESLLKLGEALTIGPDQVERDAKDSIRRVLKAVHERSGCPIDRFSVSGSCGHQSDNANDKMGFDITVFVDCKASHGQLESMECSIQSAEKIYHALRPIVTESESNHFGMHFKLDGYNYHVAVTPSMGKKMHLQRKAVWDLIEKKDREGSLSQPDLDILSISLHESLTSFMHMGDPVFHDMIRLGRLWRQWALLEQGCGELPTLAVVMVMMRCIEDEKARGMSVALGETKFPLMRVFKDFLNMLADLDNLTISFQRFYEPDMVPERHQGGTKPTILDPVNPWRNVVHNMTHEGIWWVKRHASECMKILESKLSTVGDLFMIPPKLGRARGV